MLLRSACDSPALTVVSASLATRATRRRGLDSAGAQGIDMIFLESARLLNGTRRGLARFESICPAAAKREPHAYQLQDRLRPILSARQWRCARGHRRDRGRDPGSFSAQ